MGNWGAGTFDNDDALDRVNELVDSDDDGVIAGALRAATDHDDYLEAPESAKALAAAETVAAMAGRAVSDLPEEVLAWVHGRVAPGTDLLALARQAAERVRSDSELKELHEEDPLDWEGKVKDLLRRLDGGGPAQKSLSS